jgi:hypothetical protein
VVVIFILGIALAAATPAFTIPGTSRNDPAVDAIATVLDRARAIAVQTSHSTTVTFDPSASRAWVRETAARPALDTTFLLGLPRGTELSAATPRARFSFDARGRASGDRLVVSSPRSRSAITVDPWSGDVRVASIGPGQETRAPP